MDDIIKITPDEEKVKSILKMISLIEERIKIQNRKKMTALIIADYYEIIKELITGVLLLEGYKTLSHKNLINYLKRYPEFGSHELSVLDDLRILRNRITYEGFFVDISYLDRNEQLFKEIIKKLKIFVDKRINLK